MKTKIPTEQEYKNRELDLFLKGSGPFHETAQDFIEAHESLDSSYYTQQLEWIENGSYGAGATLRLSTVWEYVNESKRYDKTAHIGQILLHALHGAPFKWWNKLPMGMQDALNEGVNRWIESEEKDFAITF
jgi:hypothetical protein